jgi:hypothetical protein
MLGCHSIWRRHFLPHRDDIWNVVPVTVRR